MASNHTMKKISLVFDANTQAALRNVQSLNNELKKISHTTTVGLDNGSLHEGVRAAQELQLHLERAVNVNTGKINLSDLNHSLQQAGSNIQDLSMKLQSLGPDGQQAFIKLANSMAQAEVPAVRLSKTLQGFLTTLANTAKWQLSSSIMHGLMGAVESAVGHAKNLNAALTDIQIVTGYGSDAMARLAKDASKAAAALNTTTTEYAKAALIFYQQGLSGSAVSERAETVVKLSQVTGQSAEAVSDQMTAIWNNFDKGTKSLEYYADAIAKLGAATAASTSEISEGLEKFAAIAETVGLSYEMAAASVATIIDSTKQSADVVGNALKTVFARVESLSLGETLGDGVNLTKYSQALKDVGVNVLTADGQLRDMDDILSDLGEKWQGLGRETQVALAQTVGGVRQYNQVMSLMNNWEDVKENIELASEATGTLAQQQKTWSASYEASLNKLKKAKDDLYEKIIDDKALITINDILTQLINGVTKFIDKCGGITPIILVLTGLFSKTLFPLIQNGFAKIGDTIAVWSGKAAKDVADMQKQTSSALQDMIDNSDLTASTKEQMKLSQRLLDEKQKLAAESKHMSEAERAEAEAKLKLAESMAAETQQILAQKAAMEEREKAATEALVNDPNSRGHVREQMAAADYSKKAATGAWQEESYGDQSREEVVTEVINKSQNSTNTELRDELAGVQQDRQDYFASANSDLEFYTQMVEEYNNNTKAWSEEEIKFAQEQISAIQSEIDAYDLEIKKLEEALKLKSEIARQKPGEGAVVGQTSVVGAGESIELNGEDKYSHRITRDDPELAKEGSPVKMQAASEDNMMANAMSAVTGGDSGEVAALDTSIENYKKLYDAIGQQTKATQKFKAAQQDVTNVIKAGTKEVQAAESIDKKRAKELKSNLKDYDKKSKAYKKLTKDEQAYVDALVEQEKTNKKNIKTLKDSTSKYIEMAKQQGASEDAIQQLEKAFGDLNEENEDNTEALSTIEATFGTLSSASSAVEKDLRLTANAMAQNAKDAGYDATEMDNLTASLESQVAIQPTLDASLENTNDALANAGTHSKSFGDTITGITSNMATLAAEGAIFVGALQNMCDVLDSDASAGDKFKAVLGAIIAGLPLFNTLTATATALKELDIIATLKAIPAKIAEKGGILAMTGALWGQVTAQLAALASNPWTLALAAVAMVAIAAIVIGINAHRKATEDDTTAQRKLTEEKYKEAEASAEQAKAHAKVINSWLDEMKTMDGLIAKYKELKKAKDEEGAADAEANVLSSKDDMIKSYQDLAKKGGLSDEQMATYQTWLDKLTNAQSASEVDEATYQLNKLFGAVEKTSLSQGKTSAKSMAVSDMLTNAHSQSAYKDNGIFFDKAYQSDSVIADIVSASGMGETWSGDSKNGIQEGWYGLKVRTDTNENFIADYEKLLQIYEQAQLTKDAGALADDEAFQEIKKIIEGSQGAYETLKELDETDTNLQIANASLQAGNVSNLSSYEDYKKHKKAVTDKVGSGKSEAIDNYFADNAATEDFVAAERRINNIVDKNGGGDTVRESLENLLKDEAFTDSDALDLFLNVDINKYQTVDAIKEAMKIAQDAANQEEIRVNISAADTALEALKDGGMSVEDWQKIRESGFDFDALGGFDEFVSMTYDEQQKILSQYRDGQAQALEESIQSTVNHIDAQMKATKAKMDSMDKTDTAEYKQLEAEWKAFQKELDEYEAQLAMEKNANFSARAQREGVDEKAAKEYVKTLKQAYGLTEDIAENIAFNNLKINEGLKELNSNYSDIAKSIENCSEGSAEYALAMSQMKGILGDVFNVNSELISPEFIANNIALIGKASAGNAQALNQLQTALAQTILLAKSVSTADIWGTEKVDLSSISIGDALSSTVLDNLKEQMLAKALTKEDVENYLSALGYVASFDSSGMLSGATFSGTASIIGDLKSLRSEKDVFKKDDSQKKKLNDELDKYYDYNKALEKAEAALNKIKAAKERAYGEKYLDYVDQEIEGINKQIDAQDELSTAISKTMEAERTSLSSKYGFTFNEDGSFSNYDDVVTAKVNAYNNAYDSYARSRTSLDNEYNNSGMTDEEYDRRLEAIENSWETAQKNYETFMEAADEYASDYDMFQNSEETLQSLYTQLSAANLEKITYSLDLKLELDTRTLEWLDYKLEKISDDFYTRMEAVKILVGEIGEDGSLSFNNSKMQIAMNNLSTYQDFLDELDMRSTTLGDDNYMSDADYKAGLESLYDATMNDISAMRELDNTMLSYYSETMSMATEELAQYTERMEHHTAVLDHYSNLMSIIGEEENYEAMGVVLEGQAHVLENALAVSSEAHAVYAAEAEKWKEKMESVVPESAEFKVYEENWKTAEATARESQEKMLSDLAAWAEAEKAILENTMNSLNNTLEKSLTGGLSFDELTTSMERAQSLQEEYLTTTNQIYETTKMMRTAQQAIDASTNTAAKSKLKNFITETKAMQEQGKLSKFELEMQQQKYNLLVAEIALEEAQNAKSTVRLQRDSEGNFGYVYTADAKAVSAAEQQFEDAQNALYNKGLEAANGYTDKYKSTMQEMYDTLTSLNEQYMNGSFESEEEYNAAVSAAKEYYYQQLQDYSHLYQTALTADSNIVAEAWSTDFADMIESTDAWKRNVDGYLSNSSNAFERWDETIAKVKETTGGNLATLAGNVGKITAENDLLTESITKDGGIIDSMKEQLTSVGAVAAAYAVQRNEILKTIKAYEDYAETVGTKLDNAGNSTTEAPFVDTPSADDTNDSSTAEVDSLLAQAANNILTSLFGEEVGEEAALFIDNVVDTLKDTFSFLSNVLPFDTGGYTGAWGPSGKMAILHEKEMVLNKHDTENLLLTIDTLRGILSTIDAYALNQQLGGVLASPNYVGGAQSSLEQNVHIEASFPGVTDRNEIEEAFNNLVNKASQYANRK